MPKTSLNTSPYFFMYEKESIHLPNIYFPGLQISQESPGKPCMLVQCSKNNLHKLQEECLKSKEKISLHQIRIKRWFDKKYAGKDKSSLGDLFLKWDKSNKEKGKQTKFQSLWIGSFMVHEKIGQHTYLLQSLDGKINSLPINGQDLKQYFQ